MLVVVGRALKAEWVFDALLRFVRTNHPRPGTIVVFVFRRLARTRTPAHLGYPRAVLWASGWFLSLTLLRQRDERRWGPASAPGPKRARRADSDRPRESVSSVLRPGERFFCERLRTEVEHARQRIGGENGTDLALDGVGRGIPGADSTPAREGIGPRRS